MKYISVTSPTGDMSKPIFKYFDDYLVSIGECITSGNVSNRQVRNYLTRILNEQSEANKNSIIKKGLYLDSGGFQIIVGYVKGNDIATYVNTYHDVLEQFRDRIDTIFALDVFSTGFLPDKEIIPAVYEFNFDTEIDVIIEHEQVIPIFPTEYIKDDMRIFYDNNYISQLKSIELIKKYPDIANKQIYILQNSNIVTFNIWKELFNELEVYKYYRRWSIGGLVGLKKGTNAKFSHAVPSTLWLLCQQKKHDFIIDQVHWLGQSSRLSFISSALFERLYNINMTCDSSQLVRFAPLEAKLPYNLKVGNDFKLIESKDDIIKYMMPNLLSNDDFIIDINVDNKVKITKNGKVYGNPVYEFDFELFKNVPLNSNGKKYFKISPVDYLKFVGKVDNKTFIDLQSQNLDADLHFGNLIADLIMVKGLHNIHTSEDLKSLHPIMTRGRIANETMNNLNYFKKFSSIIDNADTVAADKVIEDIVIGYTNRDLEKREKERIRHSLTIEANNKVREEYFSRRQ